jgi:hypothetical protein
MDDVGSAGVPEKNYITDLYAVSIIRFNVNAISIPYKRKHTAAVGFEPEAIATAQYFLRNVIKNSRCVFGDRANFSEGFF